MSSNLTYAVQESSQRANCVFSASIRMLMNELSPIPTPTLKRMYTKVRTIMFVVIGVDVVAVAVFALLMVSPGTRRLVPILAPFLLLPTIAIVPVLGRLGAIGVEIKKRDSAVEAAAARGKVSA